MLGFQNGEPLHVVVAKDEVLEECWLVTVYVSDLKTREDDFKTRKK